MPKPSEREQSPKLGWVGLGVLVAALAVLVVWSLPREGETGATGGGGIGAGAMEEGGAGAEGDADRGATTAPGGPAARITGSLEMLPEAQCELAVLTEKSEAEVRALGADAIAKTLDVRHCGPACDVVRRTMLDKERFEVDFMTAEDLLLPPKEAHAAMGPTLTPEDLASIGKRTNALVVHAHARPSVDQVAARACFAATAAAAELLGGMVYDETARRFEAAAEFAQHVVTAPLGKPVFVPRQIVVQLYRQPDGGARLVTLGMARFGAPDLVATDLAMADGPAVANAMNAVAWHASSMQTALPFVVTLADVAHLTGQKGEALARDPGASKPMRLDVAYADRAEGDPDDVVMLVPPAGGWSEATDALLGGPPQRVMAAADDPELEELARKARAGLPQAIKRWKAGEGALFLKGPFAIPGREDAGAAGSEWMWIDVASCDARACSGTLSNTPGYATNLAQGKATAVDPKRAADWLLRLRDGGTAGGTSIRALEERAKR